MKYRIRPTTFVCTECGGHRPKLFDFLSEEDGGRTTLHLQRVYPKGKKSIGTRRVVPRSCIRPSRRLRMTA